MVRRAVVKLTNRKFVKVLLFPLKLLWWFFSFIFRILWHPVILIFVTVAIELIFRKMSQSTFSFAAPVLDSGASLGTTESFLLVFILIYVPAGYLLGVGYRISGLFIRQALLPLAVLCILVVYRSCVYFRTGEHLRMGSAFLTMNVVLFSLMAAATALVSVLRFFSSHTSEESVGSAALAGIRTFIRVIASGIRWVRTHRLVAALITIQLIFNVFLLYRLADVESRTGGSLFTMCSADESIKLVKKSIVRIASEAGEGTGMIVREDGYILTNAHVIAEDPSPKIIFSDYSFLTSKVIFRDTDKDIAVVKVEGKGFAPVTFADPKDLAPGSALYAVGYPMGTALRGDATIAKFTFTSVRSIKDFPTDMVQMDGVGTGGSSGGPVVTSCGEVIGMFSNGAEGISLAIPSKALEETIGFLTRDPSAWPKPPEFAMEPDKSAEEAVRAFYTFIKMRDFKRAYLMVTPERVRDHPLEKWVEGYAKTLDVTLISLQRDTNTPSPTPTPLEGEPKSPILTAERVLVRIRSLDLEGQDIVVRYFEGPWIVVWDGEFWRLGDSNIKPVPEPGWDWFW
jgi:S1-C subfamily serine protease